MRSVISALCVIVVVLASSCASEPSKLAETGVQGHTLVGQLRLPPGDGSRGVEVVIMPADGETFPTWELFDGEGHFTHIFEELPINVTISTGLAHELLSIDIDDTTAVNASGVIDLGELDLRDALESHVMVVRAAAGATQGAARMALYFGLPPVGPNGERVALGSRQFPTFTLGDERQWLIPRAASSIYFLVERGSGPERGWRGTSQQLFGPFTSSDIPSELHVD